ncbi:hypothetical protein AJ79_07544 [Helicocarpus griseus UAMH5409]|uniref:Xylanolytic transcriptional activator regulatory domain-containing protein n=1 Tax=Helicocarpus griseus UAMH5409 TaxID=1447875 RepID=A0A2B7X1L6_9EURO|nr:hypothetical protein AJ79_07544 [Helicocarpus griseus UAMH5409]
MPENTAKPGGLTRKSAFSCQMQRSKSVMLPLRGTWGSLTPTLSYTKTLEARIAELEATLAKLQDNKDDQDAEQKQPQLQAEDFGRSISEPAVARDLQNLVDDNASSDLARGIDGLKVGDDGRISLYGPTSLFQLPSGLARETSNPLPAASELDGRKERLINNAWRERAFEQLATIPDPFQYLLDSHWCWIHPLFNFVYRPAFTRDMKMNGPYYSDILLNAILSHSIRWCKDEPKIAHQLNLYDGGAQFFHRACSGLFNNVQEGNGQIPIVQSLLLLSAQECGRGNRTQAWLYSGMAFRLVEDLGITIDSRKYSGSVQFSDEDIEIRNRLFWCCYFWDKLVSLYFGRSPIIQDTPVSPPRILLDDTAEIEIWTPHGVIFPEGTHYPPTQAHATSCFMKMCSLTEILNQIIIHIYDPIRKSTEAEFKTCVEQQSRNLEKWWDELPQFLKLIVDRLPPYSPPSHIVTLNCVYHTVNILLHRPTLCSRPFRGSQQETNNAKPLVQCISSATSIIALFDLYRRTFGDGHVVLSLAYSIYTAASIFLLEMQALRYASPSTLDKLRYCIVALDRVTPANPVIKTALSLIDQELEKLGIDIRNPANRNPQPIISLSHNQQRDQQQQGQSNPSLEPSHSHQTPQSSYTVPPPGAFSLTPPPLADHHNQIPVATDPSLAIPDALKQEGVYAIAPELFEAFSYVEPLSVNMGGEFDSGWGSTEDV